MSDPIWQAVREAADALPEGRRLRLLHRGVRLSVERRGGRLLALRVLPDMPVPADASPLWQGRYGQLLRLGGRLMLCCPMPEGMNREALDALAEATPLV